MTPSERIANAIEWATAAVIAVAAWGAILWLVWTIYGEFS